ERRIRARRRAIIGTVVVLTLAVLGGGVWLGRDILADSETTPAASEKPNATPSAEPSDTPAPKDGDDTEAAPGGAPRPTAPGECIYVEARSEDEKWFGLPESKV